ncbi:putative nuclease of restriction endonuclease-like (RecB) superfamily [Pedobacter sp. UYP24]
MKEPHNPTIVSEIKTLIEQSKQQVAVTVNTTMSLLYWQIGKRINEEVLGNEKAAYGKAVIENLSRQLKLDYGSGWSKKQLLHCLYVVETFPELEKFSTLCRQLSWSHIKVIMYMNDPLKTEFYIQMCIHEKWSVRVFQERIQSMLYERTAISKKPEETISNELKMLQDNKAISPDLVFRDPYFLDFLGLADSYSEKDLESSILTELQRSIIELGSDFAFMARQKRITIDNRDYYIDLLFYHRRLKCLVAIELKLGEFEAANKGQMELYLRYLERHEQVEGENSPIGLILCTGKNEEHVELMQLDQSNIRVAEYLTLLPSEAVLRDKLHRAVEIAQNRLQK